MRFFIGYVEILCSCNYNSECLLVSFELFRSEIDFPLSVCVEHSCTFWGHFVKYILVTVFVLKCPACFYWQPLCEFVQYV